MAAPAPCQSGFQKPQKRYWPLCHQLRLCLLAPTTEHLAWILGRLRCAADRLLLRGLQQLQAGLHLGRRRVGLEKLFGSPAAIAAALAHNTKLVVDLAAVGPKHILHIMNQRLLDVRVTAFGSFKNTSISPAAFRSLPTPDLLLTGWREYMLTVPGQACQTDRQHRYQCQLRMRHAPN